MKDLIKKLSTVNSTDINAYMEARQLLAKAQWIPTENGEGFKTNIRLVGLSGDYVCGILDEAGGHTRDGDTNLAKFTITNAVKSALDHQLNCHGTGRSHAKG